MPSLSHPPALPPLHEASMSDYEEFSEDLGRAFLQPDCAGHRFPNPLPKARTSAWSTVSLVGMVGPT